MISTSAVTPSIHSLFAALEAIEIRNEIERRTQNKLKGCQRSRKR